MAAIETKRFEKKRPRDADTNPCYKEQKMSFDCLSRNGYVQDKCLLEFENYNECKSFWNTIRIERMRKGIEPFIPIESERIEILKERFLGKKEI